jgi:hypothetical protein
LKKRRKKTWAELHAWEMKVVARSQKEMKKKKRFPSREEAFEHWFAKYAKEPKWLRNLLMIRGMRNSLCGKGGCYSEPEILAKLARIDEKRLIAEKRAFIDGFEYLFTFTYDGAKYTEKTFRKGIKKCLRGLERTEGWKYVAVWQRGQNNKRLYLRAMVKTGNGEIIGGLEKVRDFQMRGKWMKPTLQSTYFNERFGRTSVEILDKEKMTAYRHHWGEFLKIFNKTKAETFASKRTPYQFLQGITRDFIR